ncbi:hypothetical protein Scep_026727 [Stephania cephalantha]|uniref:Uncharacterized protein n=1 Tax=Stephania cephalantha TaxID=152367 RepID=A0AAP0ESZ6_9MAGN
MADQRSGAVTTEIAVAAAVVARRGRRPGTGQRDGAASDAGSDSATPVSNGPARQRRRGSGSDRQRRTSGDATRRNSTAVAATDERRRGCDAMNGAVARCRPVGCAISTKSRRRDGAIVEIVVDRVSLMASESRLLFICDMSSYPDAVDISQLSVRWGL